MPSKDSSTPVTVTTHQSLPEISVLIHDTVNLFKKTALSFLVLVLIQTVIAVAIFVAVALVAVLIGTATGFANVSTLANIDASQLTAMVPGLVAGLGVFIVALLVISLLLGPAFQASLILLVAENQKKSNYGTLLKAGFKHIVPVLIATFVISFITLGGFFLFIIPGLVIALLASFTIYEIVLAGRKPLVAVYSSVNLVSQHFWGVFGRFALFMLVNWGIYGVIGVLQQAVSGTSAEGLIAIVQLILNIALIPLGMIFNFVLYKQVKEASNEKTTSPTWIWIVAIVGWVLMVLFAVTLGRVAMEAARNSENTAMTENTQFDWNQMANEETMSDATQTQETLALTTFAAINSYRQANNLEPLTENAILCYFADLESQSSQIPGVYQHVYTPLTGAETSQEIVNEWVASEVVTNPSSNKAITNREVTEGCVTVQEDALVFVGSTTSE